jgi:branched-chain amino acid transport system substrate-binding protein
MAADEIKSRRRLVLGRKLELVERDDETEERARRLQIAQELINKEKVTATVGYINIGVALCRSVSSRKPRSGDEQRPRAALITQQSADEPELHFFRNAAHDSIQAPMTSKRL